MQGAEQRSALRFLIEHVIAELLWKRCVFGVAVGKMAAAEVGAVGYHLFCSECMATGAPMVEARVRCNGRTACRCAMRKLFGCPARNGFSFPVIITGRHFET